MDINTFRGLITVVLMVIFIGIVLWAYSSRRKSDFDEAARLPLDENESKQEPAERRHGGEGKDHE
ncbi:CcoQ/FixQ family Cbb3-type cytochrome c oxidase assembly chaperone [Alkalilimnicola ehrlichii]|uniref:CcoQ/FixQ family Cbb3-type cytochrome c oxidase assembly chaperone n=1 Tax=Alkalilimnicola ehrlichii TaxID=351052 RepID=A0A3E0X4L1_9GAMM|nr:cbb3-type cytochrome c oxidase subunit 3 [Alkalilimnicola ehrlichii]RFA31247.1 CcoQ/FixQ family Cbb3-type cytochrome c oxidase assembly chaperone [Alkalilimnicola ehrlichii]RFA39476.1 CcoQ/FixQ family Cbb3-type cytochrome c oxidase assembly chaperone [Alkalilimnicola ehrlichii]